MALPARRDESTASYTACLQSSGWNACLDEIAKLGPLYTHPAPPVQQGEPVAWTYLLGGERRFFPTDPRPSHGAHANLITDAQPVYTHADAGESERLQRRIQNAELALKVRTKNADDLRESLSRARKAHGESHGLMQAQLEFQRAQLASWQALAAERLERVTERDSLLRKALASSDEATEVFEDDPNGPGRWACHACDGYTNASWRGGKIVVGSAQEIAHDSDCWAEQARKLIASAEPSAREAQALKDESRLGIERLPAEPSAPVELDERAEFDAWTVRKGRVVGYMGWREDFVIWKARAALGRKP